MQYMFLYDRKGNYAINTIGVVCHIDFAHIGYAPLGPMFNVQQKQCDCDDETLTANQTDNVYQTSNVQV